MDESNDILKALSQVPELTETVKRILAADEEFKKLVAEIMKQRMRAEIPQEERQSIIADIIEVIKETPCDMPDTEEFSKQVAEKAVKVFREAIRSEAKQAVKEAVQENPVTLAKPHEYAEYIEPKLRNWALAMTILVISFVVSFIGTAIYSAHSEEHFAQLYMEKVLNSKFITADEHEMLIMDSYVTSALPNDYMTKPKYVKRKIKRWVEILEQREEEAKVNDGNYSTAIPLER